MAVPGFLALAISLLATPAAIANDLSGVVLAADDECAASAGEGGCGLQALQLRAQQQAAVEQQVAERHLLDGDGDGDGDDEDDKDGEISDLSGMGTEHLDHEPIQCIPGEGHTAPWCGVLRNFSKLFDTNDPAKMQQALDLYCKFKGDESGLTIALTKRDYYLMYHNNLEKVLKTWMGTGTFAWHMGEAVTEIGSPKEGTYHLVRNGTFKLNLGWKKVLFTKTVMRTLPHAMTFPFSTVDALEDCPDCPAKFLFTVKQVGFTGTEHDWLITEILLVKLAKPSQDVAEDISAKGSESKSGIAYQPSGSRPWWQPPSSQLLSKGRGVVVAPP